jgi:hypothetical protein
MRLLPVLLLTCCWIRAQETAALKLTLQGGAVVGLENRLTGEVYTRPAGPSDGTSALRLVEGPGQIRDVPDGEAGVGVRCEAKAAGVDLGVQQPGHRDGAHAAGVWLGIGPLDPDLVKILIPGVGGVGLDASSLVADMTYYYPGAWGTPALVLQGAQGGVLISADSPASSFKALRVIRLATAWRLMLLTDADPPFAARTDCASAPWRFTAYRGPWTVAAALQRDRLQREFGLTPLAQRRPDWLPRIRCVVRVVGNGASAAPLQALAREVDPAKTLLYLPDWRTNPYDVMYPDYTPTAAAIEFIRVARGLGFRVMTHGNLVGISPFHPRMKEFEDVIQRDPTNHQPVGWYLDRDTQGKIYCLNLAFAKARKLLVDAFVESYRLAGFDALHLDFPLIVNADSGPVEGRNPIQGGVAFLRELQAALPGVPLGTEGIADYLLDCSFAQLGEPLWNNREVMGRYHPIRAAMFSEFCNLYGHLGIPDQQTDLQAYLNFIEVHDRVGCLPTLSLNLDRDFDPTNPGTHFALRQARYFTDSGPVPDFATVLTPIAAAGDPPALPYFAWRQADGKGLAVVQTPSGRKWLAGGGAAPWQEQWRVYQNVTQIAGDLHLPGWLAYTPEGLFGLDPQAIYLPEPGRPDATAFHLAAASVPVRLSLCGSDDRRDLVRIEPLRAEGTDLTALRPDRVGILVQGEEQPLGHGGCFQLETGTCGGVARLGWYAHPPWQFPEHKPADGPLRTASFGEFRLRLPDAEGLRFTASLGLRDLPDPKVDGGDGVTFRVLVDGREVHARHHAVRQWEDVAVDLAAWRGKEITLRLLTDPGPAGRLDCDWAMWGEPRVSPDPKSRRVTLDFVPPTQGGTVVLADAFGSRTLAAGARQAEAALPATLLCLRAGAAVSGPGPLAKLPYTTSLVSGGVLTRGSVFGGGDATTWKDDAGTRPAINGHTPAWGQTHLEWALALPPQPLRLRFDAGIVKGGEQVSFTVLLNGIPAWHAGWPGAGRSVPATLDLTPWAGQPLLLSLVTDADGTNNCDWAIWIEPRLEAAGE